MRGRDIRRDMHSVTQVVTLVLSYLKNNLILSNSNFYIW